MARAFDGNLAIERAARDGLRKAAPEATADLAPSPLPASVQSVLAAADAHPVSRLIAETPLPWAPPQTTDDPAYIAASRLKVHVELLGPEGLVRSDTLRLGLYGMQPGCNYGNRTHPAEEIFVMVAGRGLWKKGGADYVDLGPGDRAHHPSMMPHATRTDRTAFMSLYVWQGDISTDGYRYRG